MKPLHFAIAAAVLLVAALFVLLSSSDGERTGARRVEERGGATAGDTEAEAAATDETVTDAGAGTLAITLHVLGPGDEVAGGAEVEVDGGLDVVRTTADAEGEVRVRGLAPGFYDLRARHGRLTGAMQVELKRSRDLGTLRLAASVTVRGRVFGARGAPLAGARVEAVRSSTGEGFNITTAVRAMAEPEEVVARATAGDDGAYELLLGAGGTYGLRAMAKGYAQEGDPPQTYTSDAEGVDFYLMPGALLQGRVLGPRQDPVAAARVFVVDPFAVLAQRMPKAEAATDASGRFSLVLAPSERNMLVVRASGYATHMDPGVQIPDPDLVVILEEGFTMRLQTVDAERPEIPAPRINVMATFYGSFSAGRTDDNGMLVLENLATRGSGRNRQRDVILWGGGYVARTFSPGNAEPVEGTLDLGVVKMQRGGVIRGRVLDKTTGEPVAGARVRTLGGIDTELEMFTTAGAESAKDGGYELNGVPLGAHTLMAVHPDYSSDVDLLELFGGMRGGGGGSGTPLFAEGSRELERDIELTPAASVTGVVLRPDGTPAAGARVEVLDENAFFAQILGTGQVAATANAEGRFMLGGLKRDTEITIVGTHRDYGAAEAVRARAGDGQEATLQLTEPLVVKGVVVDDGGAPVESVRVQVQRAGEQRSFGPSVGLGTVRAVVTDDEGRYLVRNVPPGELMAEFEHPDYAPVRKPLRLAPGAPAEDLGRTVLPRGGMIAGVVVDTDGQPVGGIQVHAGRHGAAQPDAVGRTIGNAVADEKGRFVIRGLQEGEFRLRVFAPNYYADNPVVAAGTRDARLVLRAAGKLFGRVLGRGQPVANARVQATRAVTPDWENLGWARTGADGTFEMGPLPPDEPFDISITHDEFRTLRMQGVRASDRVLDLVLEAGQEVAGRVVDVRGQGVGNARVQVRAGDITKSVQTGAAGAFTAGGLGEGRITVRLTESGQGFIESDWIEVAPGSRSVRLVATSGESIAGVLRDGAGNPVRQARVDAIDAQGMSAANVWVWTDDGSFELRGLPPGTYTLRVIRFVPGETQQRPPVEMAGVVTGTTNVVIRLDG